MVPQIDNHPLATWMTMLDRIDIESGLEKVIDFVPAMSTDMNQIEYAWINIGRKLNQRNPQCQKIAKLKGAIVQE